MTSQLLLIASHNWEIFDGWCASQSLDPLDLPLDRFANLIYFWATRDREKKDVEKFDAQLWIPPKGEAPAEGSVWSAEKETEALAAFANQVGQKGPDVGKATVL